MKVYCYIIINDRIEVSEFENGYIVIENRHNKKMLKYGYKFFALGINHMRVGIISKCVDFISCYKLSETQIKKLKNELHRKMKQYEIS